MCICFNLSLQINFPWSSAPLDEIWPLWICILQFQTDRLAWPSWLQFQIPGRKDITGSALLMIPALFQWAMTREHAHTVEMRAGEFPHQPSLTVDSTGSFQKRGKSLGTWQTLPKISTIIIFTNEAQHIFHHKWVFWENNKCWVPMTC